MGTQSLRADDSLRRLRPGVRHSGVKNRRLRYQLNVIACSAADVVQSAGGWLLDRGMAGWEVNVLVAGQEDTRPLRILGVRTHELRTGFASIIRGPERAAGLAVAADLVACDERVHEEVVAAIDNGLTEVALWGDGWTPKFGGRVDPVQYRLSATARVFKGHALTAAGLADVSVGRSETLLRTGYCPLDSDLIPF